MPQTQVGTSEGPLAWLPGWMRQDTAPSSAAPDTSTALNFLMVRAEDGSPTARHAARPVPAQGTRILCPTTLLPALDGYAGNPINRGLAGRQGTASGRAPAGSTGAP